MNKFDGIDYEYYFRTPYNVRFNPSRVDNEVNVLPSMTQPDMSMSIEEILARFARGENPMCGLQDRLFYSGEEELPDVHKMSEMDRIDYSRALFQHTNDLKHTALKEAAAARAAAASNNDSSVISSQTLNNQ